MSHTSAPSIGMQCPAVPAPVSWLYPKTSSSYMKHDTACHFWPASWISSAVGTLTCEAVKFSSSSPKPGKAAAWCCLLHGSSWSSSLSYRQEVQRVVLTRWWKYMKGDYFPLIQTDLKDWKGKNIPSLSPTTSDLMMRWLLPGVLLMLR